ncbi:hypothetical protein HYV69_00185 [Candidatus Uhrbacteria bacterium]|nr:hypothetical protein [Candidatus Uhrbacteria bacterium]
MLRNRLFKFFNVFVHTFVAWVVLMFALNFFSSLPHNVFAFLHIVFAIIIFAIVFHSYYQANERSSPFFTVIQAIVAFVIFEIVYINFFQPTSNHLLDFVDWILPFFLIASTIYAVGKQKRI